MGTGEGMDGVSEDGMDCRESELSDVEVDCGGRRSSGKVWLRVLVGEGGVIEKSEVGIVVGESELREREYLSERSRDEGNKEAKLGSGGCEGSAMRL